MMRSAVPVTFGLLLFLGSCWRSGSSSVNAGTVRSSSPAEKLLYQTRWREGTQGWLIQPGFGGGQWSILKGKLAYDGNNSSMMAAPFKTGKLRTYAIQASIKAITFGGGILGDPHVYSYGIFFRGKKPDFFMTSIRAGMMNGSTGFFTGRYLPYAPIEQTSYQPNNRWHTYRLEVRGNNLRFLIDGQDVVDAVSDLNRTNTRIGLFADDTKILVRGFKVFALNSVP